MTTETDDPEFFNAYLRAEEAGGRGDVEAAERWTNLMERQCAVLERVVEAAVKADYNAISVLKSTDRFSNRAARRAARKCLRED